jgi:hypothetical protein
MINRVTLEGPVTVKSEGETVTPRGWQRVRLAWRCLRGKPIVFVAPFSITECSFHDGITFEEKRESKLAGLRPPRGPWDGWRDSRIPYLSGWTGEDDQYGGPLSDEWMPGRVIEK